MQQEKGTRVENRPALSMKLESRMLLLIKQPPQSLLPTTVSSHARSVLIVRQQLGANVNDAPPHAPDGSRGDAERERQHGGGGEAND